jgi:hypothetical protein
MVTKSHVLSVLLSSAYALSNSDLKDYSEAWWHIPSTKEAKAGGLQVQDQLGPHMQFQVILSYKVRLCLKKKNDYTVAAQLQNSLELWKVHTSSWNFRKLYLI